MRQEPSSPYHEDPEEDPVGPAKRSLDSHRMEIKCEGVGGESRVYWRYRESRYRPTGCPGDSEMKGGSLVFSWGLGFLLAAVIWCTYLLRHPGTGQKKDRVQVSFMSHSFPEARCLGIKVFWVSGLGKLYNDPAQSLLRCYLLCWNAPKISLFLCARRTSVICITMHV